MSEVIIFYHLNKINSSTLTFNTSFPNINFTTETINNMLIQYKHFYKQYEKIHYIYIKLHPKCCPQFYK